MRGGRERIRSQADLILEVYILIESCVHDAITCLLIKIGSSPMPTKWSELLLRYIRDNAGHTRDEDLAAALSKMAGRTISTDCLRRVRQRMGIKKLPGRGIVCLSLPPVFPEDGTNRLDD
jgi:hypothetical protein